MDPYSNTDSRKLLSTDSIWIRITGCIMLTCVLCTEVDLEEVGELTPLEIMEADVILDTSTPHPITTQVRVHPPPHHNPGQGPPTTPSQPRSGSTPP